MAGTRGQVADDCRFHVNARFHGTHPLRSVNSFEPLLYVVILSRTGPGGKGYVAGRVYGRGPLAGRRYMGRGNRFRRASQTTMAVAFDWSDRISSSKKGPHMSGRTSRSIVVSLVRWRRRRKPPQPKAGPAKPGGLSDVLRGCRFDLDFGFGSPVPWAYARGYLPKKKMNRCVPRPARIGKLFKGDRRESCGLRHRARPLRFTPPGPDRPENRWRGC